MISCEMILIGSRMNYEWSIGMPRKNLDMSTIKDLSPGVDSTEFQSILTIGKFDVGVLTSCIHTIRYPPTMSLDLLGSEFCGLYDTTILP